MDTSVGDIYIPRFHLNFVQFSLFWASHPSPVPMGSVDSCMPNFTRCRMCSRSSMTMPSLVGLGLCTLPGSQKCGLVCWLIGWIVRHAVEW